MDNLTNPLNWLAAFLLCIIMGAAPLVLDGPDDITVMEQIAADKADAESGKSIDVAKVTP